LQHRCRSDGRLQHRSKRPASADSATMKKVMAAAIVSTNLFI
jgi:hypothetical protein